MEAVGYAAPVEIRDELAFGGSGYAEASSDLGIRGCSPL
jgi:hypothetical protein